MEAVKNITDLKYFIDRGEIIDPEYDYKVSWHQDIKQNEWTSLPTFMFSSTNCRVNSLPLLITEQNHLITEHVWPLIHKYKNKPEKVHTVFTEWQDAMSVSIPEISEQFNENGKYVWLPIDEYSAENPWHIWIDVVSKIRLIEKYFPNFLIEHFVFVLANPSSYFDKIAKVFFPKIRYLTMPKNTTWKFKHLIVPSMSNHKDGIITPRLPEWIQRLANRSVRKVSIPNKKIIVTRQSGNRSITNQEQLILALKGWETVSLESMDIKQQVECFSNASHILSPHGAGLINLLWCQPKTKVIEIQHRAFLEKKVYPILSHHLRLDHEVFVAETEKVEGPKPKNKKMKDMVNFRLNINELISKHNL